jgi:hypothetical protein
VVATFIRCEHAKRADADRHAACRASARSHEWPVRRSPLGDRRDAAPAERYSAKAIGAAQGTQPHRLSLSNACDFVSVPGHQAGFQRRGRRVSAARELPPSPSRQWRHPGRPRPGRGSLRIAAPELRDRRIPAGSPGRCTRHSPDRCMPAPELRTAGPGSRRIPVPGSRCPPVPGSSPKAALGSFPQPGPGNPPKPELDSSPKAELGSSPQPAPGNPPKPELDSSLKPEPGNPPSPEPGSCQKPGPGIRSNPG